jgi:energy-coupling factor transporter ATP-binding protein EcfA2
MWVESITLDNIKCFQKQKISFIRDPNTTQRQEKLYNWVTLLGENGVGKSTILQSLALLLAGPVAALELLPRPNGWLQNQNFPGSLNITLRTNSPNQNSASSFSYSYLVTGARPLEVNNIMEDKQTYTEPSIIPQRSDDLLFLRINPHILGFAVGYGAFRRLTRSNQFIIPSLEEPRRSSNFFTQFNEDISLSSFERWMVYVDYRLAKNSQDFQAQKMKKVGEAAITKLLPGNIHIAGVTAEGLIEFSVDGQVVPSISLSDGFRSVIALAGDLIWRLMQAFPDLDDPTTAPGVVLIDELDIHLHPSWQREIAGWFQQAFPNLQFFVATHSPLVAAGAGEDALILHLDMVDNQIQTTKVPYEDLAAGVDRTLKSPAFGLQSTYSPSTEHKIQRYHELQRKNGELSEAELSEYEHLQLFMKETQPFGTAPAPGSLESRIDALLEDRLR